MPFDILIFDVTRQDGAWWLAQRAKRTLDESICRDLKNQVRDRGVFSTLALYPAFQTAMGALHDVLDNARRQSIYLFSQCNANPVEMFERGRSLEAGSQLEVVCFSCPVERRTHPVINRQLDQSRRAVDGALRAS
ncbi:MAG: hypothetical protein H6981_12585 [Gammaproteobacteria bacterium]|nr:hypothetical protein [Gammaproteobacteria bacterium]MCP5137623.1 hypothetical protein [Gammaproteobacteria bacterium]